MFRQILLLACVYAVTTLASASADEIGISGATGSILFTNLTDPQDVPLVQGPVMFTTTGFMGNGTAMFQSPMGVVQETGNVQLGPMSGTLIPVVNGLYAVMSLFPLTGESFSYQDATDTLTGNIHWNAVKAGTNTPQFDVGSTLTVTSAAGSPLFVQDFPVGSQAEADMTIALGPSAFFRVGEIDQLICDTIVGMFSTAAILPQDPDSVPVPEPNSLWLIIPSFVMLFLATRGRAKKLGLGPERAL